MFELILLHMMKSLKVVVALVMVGSLFLFPGCGKSPTPTPPISDQQLTKLSKTWKATTVTLNNTAQTGYTNFQIVMSGTAGQTTFNYTTSGRPTTSPWAASGTFTFGTDAASALIREDNLAVTYSVTDTPTQQLQMTFNYTGNGIAGRISQVQGTWVFTFN
jgi:hypothetical protein